MNKTTLVYAILYLTSIVCVMADSVDEKWRSVFERRATIGDLRPAYMAARTGIWESVEVRDAVAGYHSGSAGFSNVILSIDRAIDSNKDWQSVFARTESNYWALGDMWCPYAGRLNSRDQINKILSTGMSAQVVVERIGYPVCQKVVPSIGGGRADDDDSGPLRIWSFVTVDGGVCEIVVTSFTEVVIGWSWAAKGSAKDWPDPKARRVFNHFVKLLKQAGMLDERWDDFYVGN